MAELSRDEITIMGATDSELYAYIKTHSLGKEWPVKIYHDGTVFEFDTTYDLPSQMKTFIQAARYLLIMP
jgi:hypothetical protein